MQYFIDNNNGTWAYEDEVSEDIIKTAQVDNNLVFTKITETEFQDAVAPNLTDAKHMKIDEIERSFADVETAPVLALAKEWDGGYVASAKYKTAYDFAEMSGLSTVDLKDTLGTRHTLSLADAKSILIAINSDYLQKDKQRDALVAEVEAATTNDDVALVATLYDI